VNYQWVHELIFGALLGNIILFLEMSRRAYKIYKYYALVLDQHQQMWEDYLYRTQLREDREVGNQKRKHRKFLLEQEKLNGYSTDATTSDD
jgi:hypothetical protein